MPEINIQNQLQEFFERRKSDGTLGFFLAALLFILDYFVFKFKGIDVVNGFVVMSFFQQVWRSLVTIIVFVGVVVLIFKNRQTQEEVKSNLLLYPGLAAMVSYIFLFGGPATIFHLVFGALIILSLDEDIKFRDKIPLLIFLYSLDFFGQSMLRPYIGVLANKLVMPVWLLYALIKNKNKSILMRTLKFIFIAFYFFIVISDVVSWNQSVRLDDQDYTEFVQATTGAIGKIFYSLKEFMKLFDVNTWLGEENKGPNINLQVKAHSQGTYTELPVKLMYEVGISQELQTNERFMFDARCSAVYGSQSIGGKIEGRELYSFRIPPGRTFECEFDNLESGQYNIYLNLTSVQLISSLKKIYLLCPSSYNAALEEEVKIPLAEDSVFSRDRAILRRYGIVYQQISETQSPFATAKISFGDDIIQIDCNEQGFENEGVRSLPVRFSIRHNWDNTFLGVTSARIMIPNVFNLVSCDNYHVVRDTNYGSSKAYTIEVEKPKFDKKETIFLCRLGLDTSHREQEMSGVLDASIAVIAEYSVLVVPPSSRITMDLPTSLLEEGILLPTPGSSEQPEVPQVIQQASRVCCQVVRVDGERPNYIWTGSTQDCIQLVQQRPDVYSEARVADSGMCQVCCRAFTVTGQTQYLRLDTRSECEDLPRIRADLYETSAIVESGCT